MIRLAILTIILLFLFGCNQSTKEHSSKKVNNNYPLSKSVKQDTLLINDQDTNSVKFTSQGKNIDIDKKSKKNISNQNSPETRYLEFPGDNNFNGKPMTQQIELSENIYRNFPDTLLKLAVERYKSYDNFFPKAISDNFEEGISKEIVIYPKELIFRFQLFENEFSSTPYTTKKVTIRRDVNGEPYAN